jgi:hypothetical protein
MLLTSSTSKKSKMVTRRTRISCSISKGQHLDLGKAGKPDKLVGTQPSFDNRVTLTSTNQKAAAKTAV